MKHLILLLFFSVLIACEKSSDTAPNLDSSTIAGLWKVKSYIDNKGKDQTSNYALYTFSFLQSDILEAKKNTVITKGTYNLKMDSGKQKLIISLPVTPSELEELNEDWILVESTSNQMTLSNISGGNGGTSTLVFTK